MLRAALAPCLLSLTLLLAGCDTAEERAEGHYQRALEFLEAGDEAKAEIELRNVFDLNGTHKEARRAYADMKLEQGDVREAVGHYLLLAEQYPDDLEARRVVARLLVGARQFDNAKPHVEKAFALAPEDPEIKGLKAALMLNEGAGSEADAIAAEILESDPQNLPAMMIRIAYLTQLGDHEATLARIEEGLAILPEAQPLLVAKVQTLGRLGREADLGPALERIVELFPENDLYRTELTRWYLFRGLPEKAEALLRERIALNPEDMDAKMQLLAFLSSEQAGGQDRVRAELEALSSAGGAGATRFKLMLAELDARGGDMQGAIAQLRETLTELTKTDEIGDTKAMLAAFLLAEGEDAESRTLVEEVLKADPNHVEGLKLKARQLTREDKTDEAIRNLRTALEGKPNDAGVLTLMAEAYERAGNRELAGERLALAVEASGRGESESLRYAHFLRGSGREGVAAEVLTDALARRPQSTRLLLELSRVYLAERDWNGASEVLQRLRAIDTPEAKQGAEGLRIAIDRARGDLESSISGLKTMLDKNATFGAATALVRSYVEAGRPEEAEALLRDRLEKAPEEAGTRLLLAELLGALNRPEEAETEYRQLIAEQPEAGIGYSSFAGFLFRQNRVDEGDAVIEEGLAKAVDPGDLKLARAQRLEAQERYEDAIALYEELYESESNSLIIANNLASLIADHREGAAEMERAYQIARRLRGTTNPALADTYGWLLYLRGDYEEAKGYLDLAANALTNNPLVQYHVALNHIKLGQNVQAKARLERALEIAASGIPFAAQAEAEAALSELSSAAQ